MDQIKFTGIVIKNTDYKERDKLVTIFTLELGVITAQLKGVNQQKAKLKFASQPFCFAEFVATVKNGYYTITECSQIESFYDIITDYNKSQIGFMFLEISCIIMQKNISEQMFLTLIKYLKELQFSTIDCNLLAQKFLLTILNKVGYGLSFNNCSSCDMPFMNGFYLNLLTGELVCDACAGVNCIKLTKQQFAVLKLVSNCDVSKLGTIKQSAELLTDINKILIKNINYRLNVEIKSNTI